jgi:translation elongation factor EF-4
MTEWTHATWNLFHCIPEKIKKDDFNHMKNEIIHYIKGICNRLPCPECAHHASIYMNNINANNIREPEHLKKVMFVFHNIVNKKTKKKTYEEEVLEKYKNMKLHKVLNDFFATFNSSSKGNFTFMSENYNRKIFTDTFLVFMRNNFNRFNN